MKKHYGINFSYQGNDNPEELKKDLERLVQILGPGYIKYIKHKGDLIRTNEEFWEKVYRESEVKK